MIDIHCHILPRLDDGASSMEEALEMARMAVDSGVTDLAATPHFPGTEEMLAERRRITARWQALSDAIAQAEIPLRLHPGAEILCTPETPRLAAKGLLPTLSGTRYLLTEFPFGTSFFHMDEMLRGITDAGLIPVVAHPERYDAIRQEPFRVERWFRRGYVLQMNKGSILGAFGSRVEQTADLLLDAGLVHIIASDAHSARRRTPHMGQMQAWMRHHLHPDYARILLTENPRRLLEDQPMAPTE